MTYWVYILCSHRNGTLYIGVTNNLPRRVYEHKHHMLEGFTKKHRVTHLVYYKEFSEVMDALRHEKRLKKWHRQWKLELIEKHNADWRDLYDELM